MCALLALKFSTSDIVADFEMKTNSDDCGDFDDVVLKVTFVDGQSQTFQLQLKHSENTKNITDKNLEAKKGDYSLPKYIKNISKFENIENISFILYTNNSTSIKSNSKVCLQIEGKTNEEVVVTELQQLDPKKLLLINRKGISDKKEGTKVFQFELNQGSGSVRGRDDSLKSFYFFANQTNTTGAQSLITDTLREKCGINDATCSSSFIQFMETWWSGNFILTKYDVVAKLAELTFTPFMQTISDKKCNEKSKLLREAIMKFDMTIVRDTNEEVIANIWNETASDEEIRLTSRKYGLRHKGIKDLSPKERSKVLWHLNKVPLIVKAEQCHEAQIKQAIRLLEKVEKKKVVLLANATKQEFPGWNIFQDLSDLPNEGVYADIIKHFAVSLQGRQSIFLDQLLNFDQENGKIIETKELIQMTQEVIQIGRRQENAFENYIPRSVSTISLDIKKMSEFCRTEDSLLIICNVSQPWNKAIRQLNLHVMELDQYLELEERNKCDVLLTSNKWPHVQFDDICEKTNRNVHLLQVFDDKSCTSVLSKKKKFSLEIMKSEGARVDEMEIFTYLDHPLNVICSPPGMGKSTLVTRLTSNCPSTYWSVRVNLIDHKRLFKKEHEHDEILHHFVQEKEDPLVDKIRSMLLQNKRMYFFLDGLDEIDSDSLQDALDFIKYISSLGHRVWITSRENLEQKVSQILNIFPIKIEELTEEQQKTYIEKRLQDLYQKEEVVEITNKIYASVDIVNSRYLLGVPLQLFIVTENFRDNKDLWREPDQEIFVLTKMYKIFFQGKKKHQHRKLGMDEYENQLGFDFDLYLEQYELPALKSCLDTTTFDKLKGKLKKNLGKSQNFLEKLKTGDPFGIVSRVTDDNQVIFSHQTYAEYFACVWLKKNLNTVSSLRDDLVKEENKNLMFIFDIMLAEKSALHLAVIYKHNDLVLKHLDKREVKDEGGRSALHLLCSFGVPHPLSWNKFDNLFPYYTRKYYSENNIEGVSTQYREIFEMLTHCDVFQKDDVFQMDVIFKWNCLDYAIRHHNLFAVEKFLEKCGDSISLESLFDHYDAETLALYSSQMAYTNLLRATIRNDSKALSVRTEKAGLTLLHVTFIRIEGNNKLQQMLMEERKKVITMLIEGGLDVNAQCNRKTTALHRASALNDDVIVKLLLDRGANINLTAIGRQNALHFALTNPKVNMELVKLLIDEKIDMEAEDMYGKNPLHICCQEGHYDALVILLENGASVNAKNDGDPSPLHTAVLTRSRNYNCVKVLLNYGANVNAVNNLERTVLHTAFQKFNKVDYNCIKMLIDHDPDINAVDMFGKTVLHAAVEGIPSPDVEVIQLLLSKGVDANKRDRHQRTALDYAVTRSESDDLVKILFNATAHDQYVTFLHYAVYQGNCFAVNLFLKDGPDLDKINVNNRQYPLHFAVENQHLRSDLLLKMTKFIQDCIEKKAVFEPSLIVIFLKKYFSNGYGSDCVSFFKINLCFSFVLI
jgi:ankyrin repeat protein